MAWTLCPWTKSDDKRNEEERELNVSLLDSGLYVIKEEYLTFDTKEKAIQFQGLRAVKQKLYILNGLSAGFTAAINVDVGSDNLQRVLKLVFSVCIALITAAINYYAHAYGTLKNTDYSNVENHKRNTRYKKDTKKDTHINVKDDDDDEAPSDQTPVRVF